MKTNLPQWVKIGCLVGVGLLLVLVFVLLGIAWYVKNQMLDSGGVLSETMAAYDVRHYRIEVAVDPESRTIDGRTTVRSVAVDPLQVFEINLDDRLEVSAVEVDGEEADFEHDDGIIAVSLNHGWQIDETHSVTITYGGVPKVALRPPWIDGFVWSETPGGRPWIGVTGQGDGGDNWWPCKDHPSDEPDDGVEILLTVSDDLVGLTNGRRVAEVDNGDGTVTTTWQSGFPINNYLVTLNIAPYVPIEATYTGTDPEVEETIVFWSLPEFEEEARIMWQQMPQILEVFAKYFGEYPFWTDKLWVAHAPYLGMEHQTLVAYGADFQDNEYGFDVLLLHELAHEWWGNKVTAEDWADFWLHEGFATYAEALYVLDTLGDERYLDYMQMLEGRVSNRKPIVQGEDLTSAGAYTGDIYVKGACVLHSLKWLIGDEAFFEVLWRFANDDPFAYGLVENEDLFALVAQISERDDLEWFWDRYLLTAELPHWSIRRELEDGRDVVFVSWDDPSFEMPLPIRIDDDTYRFDMKGGEVEVDVPRGATVEVDPEGRVLAAQRR